MNIQKRNELYSLMKEFRNEWPIKRIKELKIDDYVIGGGNKHNFCYWVEIKTSKLGTISGIGGGGCFKFGIFKTEKKYKNKNRYNYDGRYAWCTRFGNSANEAFSNIKAKIIKIINASISLDLNILKKELDININKRINQEFGWKIVYLYSKHGRFFPAFDKEFLVYVADSIDKNKFDYSSKRMDVQNFIYKNRDRSMNLFDLGNQLWCSFKDYFPVDDDEELGTDGGTKIAKHKFGEREFNNRNPNIARKLKKNVIKCESCKKKVNKEYKLENKTIFELHHIKPFYLPYWSLERGVKREDYAVICPNCHRAIHKHMRIENVESMSITKFRSLINYQ